MLGLPATATAVESLHSVVGIILRKQRSCLTDENLAAYSLLRVVLASVIKRNIILRKIEEAGGIIDADAVEREWLQSSEDTAGGAALSEA